MKKRILLLLTISIINNISQPSAIWHDATGWHQMGPKMGPIISRKPLSELVQSNQINLPAYIKTLNVILIRDDVKSLKDFIQLHPDFNWTASYLNLPWSKETNTALCAASWLGAYKCIEYLLKTKPGNFMSSLNGKSGHGFTALDYAQNPPKYRNKPQNYTIIAKALQTAGAQSMPSELVQSNQINLPAYIKTLNVILIRDDVKSLKDFIQQYPDFNWTASYLNLPWSKETNTALCAASWFGAYKCIEYLLKTKPGNFMSSLNGKSGHGFTALHYAQNPPKNLNKPRNYAIIAKALQSAGAQS